MAVEIAAFRDGGRFPEFFRAPDGLVQAAIDEAALEVDADVWGDKADTGIGLLAAHKLAVSPFGQAARLASEQGESTYGRLYRELRDAVACGLRY